MSPGSFSGPIGQTPTALPTPALALGTQTPADLLSLSNQLRKKKVSCLFTQQLRVLMPLKQLWGPLGEDVLTWLLTILGPLGPSILACKVGWCQMQLMVHPPAGAEYQCHCGHHWSCTFTNCLLGFDWVVENSGAAKRRGKG